MSAGITCTEFEVLLADFLDGTLPADQQAAFASHRATCAACAELAGDAAGAMAFMERAAAAAPPPALLKRIVREVANGPGRRVIQPSWTERLFGRSAGTWLGAVLQPRLAMGTAMAVLSLALVGRFGPAAENGVHRAWDRALKNYESLALVYDVQTQLQEWGSESAGNGAMDK
jgi:anti-sigma factor RsiW